MTEHERRQFPKRRFLGVLLALAFMRALLYALVTPPWQAPDETGHFEYAWLIAELGYLPSSKDISPIFERELVSSLYEWRYGEFIGRPLLEQMPVRMHELPIYIFARRSRTILGRRFSLAYLWQALFLTPFRHQDMLMQLYVARLSSVFLLVGVVWLAWKTFHELMPERQMSIVVMTAFLIFLPQHTFIFGTVGDGQLAELIAGSVFYAWCSIFRRRAIWPWIGIVAGSLAGMLTKRTALFLLPFNLLALAIYLRFHHRRRWEWKEVVSLAGSVVLLLFGVIFFLRTPQGKWIQVFVKRFLAEPKLFLPNERLTLAQALVWTYDSFWAQFGWMSLRLTSGWYWMVYVFTFLAFGGWVLRPKARCSMPSWGVGLMAAGLGTALIVFLAFIVLYPTGLAYYQGRYLFPAIFPFIVLLIGGLERWVSGRSLRFLAITVIIVMIWFDAICIGSYIVPFYYLQWD